METGILEGRQNYVNTLTRCLGLLDLDATAESEGEN